ncbi:hypothetical protein AAC387_Pa12g1942 [Persea americana]
MMTLQSPQHLIVSHLPFSFSLHPSISHLSPSPLPSLPTTRQSIRAHLQTRPDQWLAQLPDQEQGPIQLPPSSPPPSLSSSPLFADPNNPTDLQVATSVLLTGAVSVFLFRSLRRRAKRAKEMRFRSSGVKKKGLKDEALDSLKAMQAVSVEPGSPPSPVQALLGGLSAGVIAIILYKFTTTVEGSLNRQAISDNFSVRQITITIRTIINGICYLATFVFGINAVGLVLYSGQLAINSFMEPFSSDSTSSKEDEQQKTSSPSIEDPSDNMESKSDDGQNNTNESQ